MAKEKIIVTVIPKFDAPYTEVIPNTLEAFQELVNGYIEVVPLGLGAVMVLNEEGKYKEVYNCDFLEDELYGQIVLCGVDGEDFTDCPQTVQDIINVVNVGFRFAQLHRIDPEIYRHSAVKLALEALWNAKEGVTV